MVYMGSKRQYCKYIVPIIQKYINENNILVFIDCFCGGANLADKINCQVVICNDLSPTLIALHKQAQQDFSLIPAGTTKEEWIAARAEWEKIKDDIANNRDNYKEKYPELYKIGALEWYGSYSTGGFPLGYANPGPTRNYYSEHYKSHKKQAELKNYKKIHFKQGDYLNLINELKELIDNKTILYCDSPYKGTKPYGISKNFDFDKYYNWLRETSKIIPIFVSEQSLPDDFNKFIVWEKNDANRTLSSNNKFKASEKLYLIDNR